MEKTEKLKLFGLDGVRGIYGQKITEDLVYKIGYSLAITKPNARIIVGNDTRDSSNSLYLAIRNGICDAKGEVYKLGIVTTPCVSYLTKLLKFDYGVMITASHNPKEYNGIKIFDNRGYKICEELENRIEMSVQNFKQVKVHAIPTDRYASNIAYVNMLENMIIPSKKKIKIYLDCANGTSSYYAPQIFKKFNANVILENIKGEVNKNAGVLDFEKLKERMNVHNADIGFAFDGDADRCICVTQNTSILDGDKILYLFANYYKQKEVVGTIQTNCQIENLLNKKGIQLYRTDVGDKYIIDLLTQKKLQIGCEQAGHFINMNIMPTGDGMSTAIQLTNAFVEAPELIYEVGNLKLFSQIIDSIDVNDKNIVNDNSLKSLVAKINKELGNNGRAFVRASGTEPKLRATVETKNEKLTKNYLQDIVACIKNLNDNL